MLCTIIFFFKFFTSNILRIPSIIVHNLNFSRAIEIWQTCRGFTTTVIHYGIFFFFFIYIVCLVSWIWFSPWELQVCVSQRILFSKYHKHRKIVQWRQSRRRVRKAYVGECSEQFILNIHYRYWPIIYLSF